MLLKIEKEYGTRTRLMRIVFTLVERPFAYTKRQLAQIYDTCLDTISGDFSAIRNAGFILAYDHKYRWGFELEKPYKHLKDLLHFSEEDQYILNSAIDHLEVKTEKANLLRKKLNSLYDFRKLGNAYLRKPYLSKIDLLIQGKNEKQRVIFEDYRSSNSNKVSNRTVEAFHISPPDDMVQAYDVNLTQLRHFRISRIKRIKVTGDKWQQEDFHQMMATDPFRIVDNQQKLVHLKLSIAAYNEMIERFPLTRSCMEPDEEEQFFDFQEMVNRGFIGITGFILGNTHLGIEVLGPEGLKEHLNLEAIKLQY